MAEIKKNFTKGRMNLDLDDRLLPQGEYREALNIQISGSEDSDVGSVKNILGNSLAYTAIEGISTNQTCVGGIVDEKNDQIYWLITGGYVVDTNLVNGDLEDSDGFVTYTQEDWNSVGSANLITDNTFLIIADGTGLTYSQGVTNPQTDHGITITTGVAVRDNTNNGTNSSLRQKVEIVEGVEYRVSYKRKYVSGGDSRTNIYIDFSGNGNQQIASSNETSGSYVTVEDTFVAGYTGTMPFRMYFMGDFVGEIDDIVIEAIEDEASRILRYTPSTDTIEPVFIDVGNEVLKFDASNYITGINIVDDFLFFTDGVNEPKKINIPVCIDGADNDDPYITQTQIAGVDATEEHITVIKKKPTRAPEMFLVRQDAPSNFGFFNDFTFLGVSVGNSVTLTITTGSEQNINANDILLLSDPNEQGNLPSNAQVRLKVVTSVHASQATPPTQTITAEVLFIDSSTTSDTVQFDYLVEDLEDAIFEKVFPRFAYRYKYRDGEYSAFSPFTDVAFSARDFNIHPTKEPYNKGMETNVKAIRLSQFVPYDIPEDVVSVDLLYKSDNDPTIYSIETIKPKLADGADNPAWYNVSATSTTIDIVSFNIIPSHTGYYEINSDNIHVVLPENQLLRLYDNVPKKALAQDFTANRLVYGNYTQNLDLGNFNNNIDLDYEVRKDIPSQNITFDTGKKSIKSLRTYKAGIVFGDKYGRETSVFTGNKTSSLKIPFEQHEQSNRLVFKNLTNVIGQDNTDSNSLLLDPYYFKAYIKETSAEYYNLVVDRVYKTKEDDNLWVSFPSSDRNKVKEDDYIILKKSLDSDDAITSDNKFKIIDIQNEAPEFIKIKYQELATVDSPSDITLLFFDSSFQPAPNFDKIKISKEVTDVDGLPNIADLVSSGKRISLKFQLADGPTNTLHSDRYNALSVSFVDSSPEHYVITLDKPIESQDSWVEVSEGVLEPNLKITFFVDEQKDWEEFQGRFFVKIVANDVSDEFLESQIGTVTQQAVVARTKTFFLADSTLFDPFHDLSSTTVGHRTNISNFNTTFGQSDTKVKWENNLDFGETSAQPNWFIDNTFAVAAQPTIVTDTSITTPSGSPYFEPYGGSVPDNDVSVSGSLFASRHPDYSGGDNPNFSNSGLGANYTFYPRFGGYVDGLEGIVDTSNGDFCPDPAEVGTFGNAAVFAPRALLTQVAGEYDQAYGPPGHTGIFMHLSFSPVGVDLHDGVNLLQSGDKDTRSNLVLNLQGINNFNQQHENYTTNDSDIRRGSYYDDNGDAFTGYSTIAEANMNKYGVCDAPQQSSLMINETLNQWNPVFNHPENQAIVDNLKIGSKFKFVNDTSNTIFTIKRVTVKRFYNHTAWNYRNIWDGTSVWNSSNASPSEKLGDTTTVHSAWSRWVKDPRGGSTNTERFEELEDAVKRFGAADNRRVTYILELDKDPRIECSINPETLALDTNTHIHFLKPYVSENSTVLSDNPAVFETEPRENTELDVYYEASNAIPLKLDDQNNSNIDNDKSYMLAPIGSKVYANFPVIQYYNIGAGSTPLVKAWEGDVLELFLGLKVDTSVANTNDAAGLAAQSTSWAGKTIKIYRSDNDYVEMEVADSDGVIEIDESGTPNVITKIKLKPSVTKVGLNYFNCYSFGNGVESNRIRDDFNQPFISNGVKVSTTLEEGYEVDNRTNGLIYSGLYNKNAKVNNLNQFIAAEKITKDLLPTYGSIQKLYARNSDLIALCEDKVVQILADKDALFNADGNMQLVSTNRVLGQSRPFVGDYGISKNPESFAAEGYRAYFTDKQRGAVLRLSMDGLTAISEAGMKDYFGDKLKGSYNKILGSYDKDKDHYNVTFEYNNQNYNKDKSFYDLTNSVTVSYKESIKGWSSFKSFIPEAGLSLAGDYYTLKKGSLYKHDNEIRNTFYDLSLQNSFINVLINDSPLLIKDFKTLNYDGDNGWFCSEITTDVGIKAEANNFVNRENKYFSTIKGLKQDDINTSELNFQGIGFSTQIRKI